MRESYYNTYLSIDGKRYLILNALRGSVDIVDDEVVDLVVGFGGRSEKRIPSGNILNYLVKRGYLTEQTRGQEVSTAEVLYKSLATGIKNTHQIVLTHECNLKCMYCHQRNLANKDGHRTLSNDDVDRIFEAMSYLDSESGRMPISIAGGEPLLPKNAELLEYVLKKGCDRGYHFAIYTNGLSLGDFAPLLVNHKVEFVSVRIEGPKSVHDIRAPRHDGTGSFDTIIRGINSAKTAGLHLRIQVNLHNLKTVNLLELNEYFKSHGWYDEQRIEISFSSCVCGSVEQRVPFLEMSAITSTAKKNAKKLFNRVRPVRDISFVKALTEGSWNPVFTSCPGFHAFIYDPFGDIYACPFLVGQEQFKIGTYSPRLILNDNSEKWKQRNVLDICACRKCKYALLCGGGCPLPQLVMHGDLSTCSCENLVFTISRLIPDMARFSCGFRDN